MAKTMVITCEIFSVIKYLYIKIVVTILLQFLIFFMGYTRSQQYFSPHFLITATVVHVYEWVCVCLFLFFLFRFCISPIILNANYDNLFWIETETVTARVICVRCIGIGRFAIYDVQMLIALQMAVLEIGFTYRSTWRVTQKIFRISETCRWYLCFKNSNKKQQVSDSITLLCLRIEEIEICWLQAKKQCKIFLSTRRVYLVYSERCIYVIGT